MFFCDLSSLKTENSTQPLPTENSGGIRLASAACGVNNHRSRLPARRLTEKSVHTGAGDRLASFPGGKPENEARQLGSHGSVTWLCYKS